MTVSGLTIAAIMGILLLVFIFSGYYLFAALGGVAILSGLAFWGPGVFQTVYFSIFKHSFHRLTIANHLNLFYRYAEDRSSASNVKKRNV